MTGRHGLYWCLAARFAFQAIKPQPPNPGTIAIAHTTPGTPAGTTATSTTPATRLSDGQQRLRAFWFRGIRTLAQHVVSL